MNKIELKEQILNQMKSDIHLFITEGLDSIDIIGTGGNTIMNYLETIGAKRSSYGIFNLNYIIEFVLNAVVYHISGSMDTSDVTLTKAFKTDDIGF